MQVHGLNHVTLRIRPEELPLLRSFYTEVLGLVEGWRPAFTFPGHWLYPPGGDTAAVHLAGNRSTAEPGALPTGKFDHVSFFTSDIASARARLTGRGIPFREAPVPGSDLNQIFFVDPVGVQVELTFRNEF